MTDFLFHDDSYLREFDAKVTGVTEDGVILDHTGFFLAGRTMRTSRRPFQR